MISIILAILLGIVLTLFALHIRGTRRLLDMRFNTGRARGLLDAVEISTRMSEVCRNEIYFDVTLAVNHWLQGCSITNPVPKDISETILPTEGLPEGMFVRPAQMTVVSVERPAEGSAGPVEVPVKKVPDRRLS